VAIYRLKTFGHQQAGTAWSFTMHTTAGPGEAASIVSTLADAISLAWTGPPTPGSSLQQLYNTGAGVDGVRVDELDSLGKNVAAAIQDLTLAGTSSDESLPPQVAMVVSERSATPTRSGRGRIFLPAPVVTESVGQRILSAAKGEVLNAMLAAFGLLNDAGLGAVLVARDHFTVTPVISLDVGDVFDTQRRRRNKLFEVRSSGIIP
jgi:hypothetical protein